MKIKIKGLTSIKSGRNIRYYWLPSPAERKAGWKSQPLGADLDEAMRAAKLRNDEVEDWKCDGGKSRSIKRYIARNTLSAAIQRYRSEHLATKAASTRRTADTPLNRLDAWAGDKPLNYVTRDRVKALKKAIAIEGSPGYLGHHAAFAMLAMGRQLFTWLIDEELAATNPFTSFGLGKPDSRSRLWEHQHVVALMAAAHSPKVAMPSLALALEIALYIGQREADILKLSLSAWREIPRNKFRMTPELYDRLASHDGPDAGKVMGIYVRQGKTTRWIGIPIEGEMRRRIERAIADAKAIGSTTILNRERSQSPWPQDDFIHKFKDCREYASHVARESGQIQLADDLETLWFSDARRTCVVTLGELGLDDAAIAAITGHKLGTIKGILEIYMPRTEAMAGRAVFARSDVNQVINLEVKRKNLN